MANPFQKLFRLRQGVTRASASVDNDAAPQAEILKNQGNAALARGDAARAAECYREAITLFPGYAEACNNLGFAYFCLGCLAEAEGEYLKALKLKPDLGQAHYNLGVLRQQTGALDDAISCFRQALRYTPQFLDGYIRLGQILYDQQRYSEAVALFDSAITHNIQASIIFHNRGASYRGLGRYVEAEANFRRAVAVEPANVIARYELGLLLMQDGRTAEAEQTFRDALATDPSYAEAQANLGLLLMQSGREAEAEAAFRGAIAHRPDLTEAHNNLGMLLMERRCYGEAEASFRRAINCQPDNAELSCNLAFLLHRCGRYAEAEAAYREILARDDKHCTAHGNLGYLYSEQRRFDEAEKECRAALSVNPQCAEASRDLGYIYLATGRLKEAWPLHEFRYAPQLRDRRSVVAVPKFSFPQWRGESIKGRSLLIWYEQGFGDEIQFSRYVPLLKAMGASRISLVCTQPLIKLFETLDGVDRLYPAEGRYSFDRHDYWVMSMSLPLQCGTILENIPASLPYLAATPERMAYWRDRLPTVGVRVGLVWKGNPKHKNDSNRSLPGLATLAPLWQVPGISFVSLQKGAGEDEAKAPATDQPLIELGTGIGDFADSASVVSQLDLVICVDTVIAHLAGALAKPCWVMLPWTNTDWRWMQERTDSPWYPGVMHLFRQAKPGDWTSVVTQVAQALIGFAAVMKR